MNHTWKDVLSVGVIRMNPSVPLLNNALEHIAGLCVGLDSRWSAVTSESKSKSAREREKERKREGQSKKDRGRVTRATKKDGKQDEKRHEIRYSWQVLSMGHLLPLFFFKNIPRMCTNYRKVESSSLIISINIIVQRLSGAKLDSIKRIKFLRLFLR